MGAGTLIDEAGRLDYEREDYFDFRWWPIAKVVASAEQFTRAAFPDY